MIASIDGLAYRIALLAGTSDKNVIHNCSHSQKRGLEQVVLPG
jgi:hypothetical protein